MITYITQPTYLPWIWLFKAIDIADVFVFYDDVQFEKQSWQSRNKILNSNKFDFIYLSININKKEYWKNIWDIFINDVFFYKKHLDILKNNYRKKPFLNEVIELLNSIYVNNYSNLSELNIALIKWISEYIWINTVFKKSSELSIKWWKTSRLINICQFFNSKEYLSPLWSKEYLDSKLFIKAWITLKYLDFEHPIYNQWREKFFPYLSIIDCLINIWPIETKKIIKNIKLKWENKWLNTD